MNEIKLITETKWEKWRAKTFYTKEPETIAWIRDFEDDCVFWDIGANIGVYSLFCAKMHFLSKVYAFEPLKANYIRLWQNIWINELENIEAYWKCLGIYNGFCHFDYKNDEIGSSGGIGKDIIKGETIGKDAYIMPITRADKLPAEIYPNYIKIDTDGAELDIIIGMEGLLKDKDLVKSILIEINDHETEIWTMLEKAGFEPDEKYNKLKNRESDKNVIFSRGK